MNSIDLPQVLKSTARCLTLIALVAPSASFSQGGLDDFADRERQIVSRIEQEQTQNGIYSYALITPLTELSLLYDEIGASVRADETIREVLTVIRANNGLESLEQVPLIRRLIRREKERGNGEAAWDLEFDLLVLADRNPDDLRSAGIMRETGDNRIETLRQYDTGVIPPEIILGCFYDDSAQQDEAYKRGSHSMHSMRVGPVRDCLSGDRNRARRALLESAQRYYLRGLNIMRLNDAGASNEVPEILMALVRTSYRIPNPGVGRQSLRDLLEYAATYSEGWLPQIEAHVQLADWDLLYASDFGTKYEDSARETYRLAYDLLIEHEIAQESIDELFAPSIPVVLPSFMQNPLDTSETPLSRGFIDVSFIVDESGKTRQIDVLERSENVARADERDLIQVIKHSRFRPRITDGQFIDSDPIVLRYYLND